jgi:hypothetical protein
MSTAVQRCRQWGLVFANPVPIPHQTEDHYDVSPDEYWVDGGVVPESIDYFADAISKSQGLWHGTTRPTALRHV